MLIKHPWKCGYCGFVLSPNGFPNMWCPQNDVHCPNCGCIVLSVPKWTL